MNAEWAVAPQNGERFALGQRDKNGAIQNAYTTGARDVIHRLSCRLEELTTQAEAGDGRAARLQAALRAIVDDAVGEQQDPLWIVRRELIEAAALTLGGQPEVP